MHTHTHTKKKIIKKNNSKCCLKKCMLYVTRRILANLDWKH